MSNKPLKVLVIGDATKKSQRNVSDQADLFDCQRVGVAELSRTLQSPKDGGPHLILLDSNLPQDEIATTVARIRESGPGLPVLVMPQNGPASVDGLFATNGAKSHKSSNTDKNHTARHLYEALLRRQLHMELSRMALCDDLTGLYNRRGFLIHGGEYMKRACRLKNDLLVFYADLDNLKQINDQFGHQEGDRALVRVAEVFKSTFRDSDITARFGGDEFTALVIDDFANGGATISHRLQRNMNVLAAKEHRYHLSLSFGTASYTSEAPIGLEKLLGRADRSLYQQKRSNHKRLSGNPVVSFPDTYQGRERRKPRSSRSGWLSSPTVHQTVAGEN